MDKENDIQEDELLDGIEEIDDVEEGHDPVNAEKNSVDTVDKAAHTGPKGKKRPGDKTGGDKTFDKPNKGIVRELYSKMEEMSQADLRKLHSILMDEDFDINEIDEDNDEEVSYDMSEDISELVSSEATLSEDFKGKAAVIMEMAVKSKVSEEVAKLEEAYSQELEENVDALVNHIDGYLNHVVEGWMKDNELAIDQGIRTEIAEDFIGGLHVLFQESYITVPEGKVDLVDELAESVEKLEEENNKLVENAISMNEELEEFKREAIIFELGEELADTEIDKLTKLSENVDFDGEESFREAIKVIKETYFGKNKQNQSRDLSEEFNEEDTDKVEVSERMSSYLKALKKS